MADYLVTDTELQSVAGAIRRAGGTSAALAFPGGFINAIRTLGGSGSCIEILQQYTGEGWLAQVNTSGVFVLCFVADSHDVNTARGIVFDSHGAAVRIRLACSSSRPNRLQVGTCLRSATLPGIVNSGAGRTDYYNLWGCCNWDLQPRGTDVMFAAAYNLAAGDWIMVSIEPIHEEEGGA